MLWGSDAVNDEGGQPRKGKQDRIKTTSIQIVGNNAPYAAFMMQCVCHRQAESLSKIDTCGLSPKSFGGGDEAIKTCFLN